MNKTKLIVNIVLGLVVLSGAFFSVFGSSLKNLKITTKDTVGNIQQVNDTSKQSKTNTQIKTISKDTDDDTYDEDDSESTTTTPIGVGSTKTVPTTPIVTSYTMTDVAAHNSATSCWSAINSNVYNLTNWVDSHPGGRAAILMICGKDGSALFNMQHGGQKRQADILAGYKIGILK